MGRPCRHLRLRAIHARSLVTFHHVMNYWCLTILFGILLSTAHGNRPPDNDDVDNVTMVTQNGITDTNVDIEYDTQTNLFYASTTRPTLQNNDITSETENTAKDTPLPSATPFDPTTPVPVDACDTEYLTVTSTPVYIVALTRELEYLEYPDYSYDSDSNLLTDTSLQSKCSMHVTAPNNSVAVRLIQSDINNISTYFYIENVGNLPQNCSDRYMVVTVDHTPCTVIISGSQFRFHFKNSDMLVELHTMDIQISTCFVTQSTAMEDARCKLKLHTRQIKQNLVRNLDEYWYGVYRTYHFYVTRYSADCTCDCPCMCTLGYREWLSTCTDGKDINTTKVDLIVYNPNMKRLSFADTGLNAIQENAFVGFYELEVLILEGNSLPILTPTICDNLPQLQVLDVSDNILTNLTSDMFKGQCEKQLLTIDLRKNKLTYYAHDVFSLTVNLTFLAISENRLVHILKTTYNSNTLLEEPSLGKNQTSNLTSGVFDSLGNLRSLYLSDNNIAALPAGVFDTLGNLWHLDLSANNIAALPAGVFDTLGNLITLDLSDNNIAALPAGVFDTLGNLGYLLDLSDNNIAALPAGVFNTLGNLELLNLSDNNIAAIPAGVFNTLGRLKELYLSDNNIAALPAGVFDSLGKLVRLDLSVNNISGLPAGVFETLVHLRALKLHDNNIASLHEDVFNSLSMLQILLINHNYVLHNLLGDVFKSLVRLRTLDLSYNAIGALPSELFTALQDLRILDLSNNGLHDLPADCFLTLEKLISLSLCCNNLTINAPQLFESLTALQVLDLSRNNIIQLPTQIFESTKNLVSLDISDNYLKYIPVQCLANLSRLIYLNMSKNSLSRLPSFSAQGELLVLDLSENSMNSLTPVDFVSVRKMTFLSLSKNNLVALPGQLFYYMNDLIFVNISYNAVQKIGPKIFGNESKLETFDMRKNEMYRILHDSFEANPQNATIIVDKFATCCFMDEAQCISIHPRPDYLTCKRMLQDVFIRTSVWVLGISAFICNAIAHYVRTQKRQGNKVQTLLISHLALSDLLMGVNMLILASADAYYGEYFPSYAHLWRQGFACKLAGFLSIFSSEGSVFFIALISIDRLLGIKYPFGGPLSTKWARFWVGLAWLMAFLISVIPIALAPDTGDVFSISEVCIGIPIVQRHITVFRNTSVEINTTSFATENEYDYEYFFNLGWVETLQDININQKHQQHNITNTFAEITGSQITCTYFSKQTKHLRVRVERWIATNKSAWQRKCLR